LIYGSVIIWPVSFVIARKLFLIMFVLLLPLALSASDQDGSSPLIIGKSGYSGESQVNSGIVQTETGTSTATSQGLGLWAIDIYNNHNSYSSAKMGSSIQLLRYSPKGGPAKLYDIWEGGTGLAGTITPLNLASGYSQESYQPSTSGRHVLFLSSGNDASNVVIVDVQGQAGAGSTIGSNSNVPANPLGSSSSLQIIDHSMASKVNEENAELITKATTFPATASKAYSWLELGKIDADHKVEWRWYSPDGALYDTYSEPISRPDGEPWELYDTYAYIPIIGYDAAKMPGKWHVDVYLDNQKRIAEQFTILGQSGQQSSGMITIGSTIQSGCHTDPATGQIICVDTAGDFSNPNENVPGGCYRDPATGQMICIDTVVDLSGEGNIGELI
jgi:hypothetical protein